MLKIGSTNYSNVKLGSTQVNKIYQGTSLVWESLDADAQAYITAEAIVDDNTKNRINNLIVGLKSYGIWTKIHMLQLFEGSFRKFNAKNPLDTDAAFRMTYTGGYTLGANGFQPNGTTGYANTHYIPSANITLNSETIAIYSTTNNVPTPADSIDIGCYLSGTQSSYLSLKNTGTKNQLSARLNATNNVVTNANSQGFYLATKNGSTTQKTFKNGAVVATATSAGTLPTIKSYLGTLNINNTPYANGWCNQNYALALLGSGLSDTEVANLYTVVQAYMTARGINV